MPWIAPTRLRGAGYDTVIFPAGVPLTTMILSRHTTRSTKVRVKLRHTCNPHAIMVVSIPLVPTSTAVSIIAAFTVSPLLSGQEYLGPNDSDNTDVCKCNTVVYALVSACGACQGATWIEYNPSCLFFHPRF